MGITNSAEEGYLRPLVSGIIKDYEELARALRDLQERIKRDVQDYISKILVLVDSAKHYVRDIAPTISSNVSQLMNIVKELIDGITKLKTEDLEAVKGFIESSSSKINEASQILKTIEELLKKPLHSYIATKYSEYLGLDSEQVLELLENLSDEEIPKIKSKIDNLIVRVDEQYPDLKEHIKKVFSSRAVQRSLNSDNLKDLPDYALYVCELLNKCREKGGVHGVNIVAHLLSRVNDYSAFSDIRRYNQVISSQIDNLVQNLARLPELFNIDIQNLYGALFQLIDNDVFARLSDVKEKLDLVSREAARIIKARATQQSLEKILEDIVRSYEEVKDGLGEYFKKEYKQYIETLKEFNECYTKEVPKDLASIVKCIYNGGCIVKCPEDIATAVFSRIRGSVNRLIEVLRSNKVIAKELCQDADIIKRVDELYDKVAGVYNRYEDALRYHVYVTEVDKISKDVIECIRAGGMKEIEIDVTELDTEIIKALIEVLRARNMRLVLRAT